MSTITATLHLCA